MIPGGFECGLKFRHGFHLGAEPVATTHSGGQGMIIPSGQRVVNMAGLAEDIFDAIEAVVENNDDWVDAVAAHDPDFRRGQLMGTVAGH